MGIDVQVGDEIFIYEMQGEPRYAGEKGTVTSIDSMGHIHGTWGGCSLIPGKDIYMVLDKEGE